MKKVRFAVCGAGGRGGGLTEKVLCAIDAVEIVAICDLRLEMAQALAERVQAKTGYLPAVYPSHLELMEKESVDAMLIATSIETHASLAIDAMERGVAVGMEVGGAGSEEDCFRLVEAYERTKTPLMFLENCCYGKDELLAASLKKHGVLGDVVYCHGSYMHDCRELVCAGDGKGYNFRLELWCKENGDVYPTHDLGPIAKILNICRGNRMVSLSSRATAAKGMQDYIARNPQHSHLKERVFTLGDVVETLIQCENGEMINLRLDMCLPTYYSRELTVRGTRGLYRQDGNMVMVDGDKFEKFTEALNSGERYEQQYLPEAWKNVSEAALASGHGGMDYLMLESFVKALQSGSEMPIDVYDAATWMSIGYLSRRSIELGGASVEIPDFTRGAYKTRPALDVMEL